MKKKLPSLCLALVLCLGLAVPVMAAEQKITVNGETYAQILPALLSQTEDKPVTLRLDTDIQLTNFRIVLGSSDYGGLFGGQVFTVVPHDVTIDLNGHTLRGIVLDQDGAKDRPTGYGLFRSSGRKKNGRRRELLSSVRGSFQKMVRPGGVEPSTKSLEGSCSIQLSYGRTAVRFFTIDTVLRSVSRAQAGYGTAPGAVQDRRKKG